MMLADVLRAYLDEDAVIENRCPEAWQLEHRLRRLEPVPVVRPDGPDAATLGSGRPRVVLLQLSDGVDAALAELEVGCTALVLSDLPVVETSWPTLVDSAVRARCQVVQVARLVGERAVTAVACQRTDALLPPRGHFGDPSPFSTEPVGLETQLRLASEHVVTDAWARAVRRANDELRQRLAALESEIAEAREETAALVLERDQIEAARAAAELREQALRRSRSVRIGRRVGGVLRAPGRLAARTRRDAG